MKRSEINKILRDADEFIKAQGFKLPPWAHTPPEEWKLLGAEYDEIRDLNLGWDVTDYGHGKFDEIGLTLFTIRNGSLKDKRYPKTYAEKLLISRENQVCPNHFHFSKTEDIINRGGGNLQIQMWQSEKKGELSDRDFDVVCDGVTRHCKSGQILTLTPGESITLVPGLYHAFWGQAGYGSVLVGEVSSVNDDHIDNRFYVEQPRFPTIEEDEVPLWLLCTEYRK
jgi:D-lyxose ketol-isomerase